MSYAILYFNIFACRLKYPDPDPGGPKHIRIRIRIRSTDSKYHKAKCYRDNYRCGKITNLQGMCGYCTRY